MDNASKTPELGLNSPEAAAASMMQTQQKYAEERAKRLRADGVQQFVDLSRSDKFKHFQDDPWIDPTAPQTETPALRDGADVKYLILGAGFGGLLFAVKLIQSGIKVEDIRLVDSAGGFGGTWYWNRYPGLMCDIESYIYMPLLEEMGYMPKHRYAYGPELREYANSIAKKYDLEDKAMFRVEIKDLTWDDSEKEWAIKMIRAGSAQESSDLKVQAQFVIVAGGLLSSPHFPRSLGIEDFRGHSFHTSRWDYKYTGGSPTDASLVNLKDKRVGIIGTGATAVQALPHLAEWAKELYVFQRTPSSVDVRGQRATDPEQWAREIATEKGWQRRRIANFNAHVSNASPKPPVNMVDDGWSNMPSFSAFIGGPSKVTMENVAEFVGGLHALDFPRQERIRGRVDEIVKDTETASKLKAWYPGWCKRPCFHEDYLPTFNRPNVKLVDTDGKGVDKISERGVVVGDQEYDLDLLIFSTGFRSPAVGSPAYRAGVTVKGRGGKTLDNKWSEGVSTLHGVVSNGYPNLFWPGPLQAGATGNQMFVLEQLATHIAYILSESARKAEPGKKVVIEPTPEAEEEWSMQIMYGAMSFAAISGCTPGYNNMEGAIDKVAEMGQEAQMKAAKGGIWGGGVEEFVGVIENWRAQGELRGLEVTAF